MQITLQHSSSFYCLWPMRWGRYGDYNTSWLFGPWLFLTSVCVCVCLQFQPQLVLVAAGFDSVLGDPKVSYSSVPMVLVFLKSIWFSSLC